MEGAHQEMSEAGGRFPGDSGSGTCKKLFGRHAAVLFMNGDIFLALRTANGAASDQSREDHVLEGSAVAEGKPGALVNHAIHNLSGRGVAAGAEAEWAIGADQFNPHEWSPSIQTWTERLVPLLSFATAMPRSG